MPKVTLTFSSANYAAIVARWGTVEAYKSWLKAQTFAQLQPPPTAGYPVTYSERH